MRVPFVDLELQFQELKSEILPAVESVMERAAFILGEEVAEFEREFAAFCGSEECVGVASGGDALLLALRALGIGPGDEVVTAANTYIATALAISAAGAVPVLVDCLEESGLIDPVAVRQAVGPSTRAILPVHLYGQAADMDPLLALAAERSLHVVEDAAQAHGAAYRERPCGAIGDVGCFSFYPGKNLGAYGDGGAIVTADADVAARVRRLRDYGQSRKHHHDELGWNSRLDTLQAAILSVKLKRVSDWNAKRSRHAAAYRERLLGLPVRPLSEHGERTHVHHLFVVRCPERDRLIEHLQSRGVSCGIHYPIPIHLQQAYRHLGHGKGDFPRAESLAQGALSLPMFPELTDEQIDYTAACIREFYRA